VRDTQASAEALATGKGRLDQAWNMFDPRRWRDGSQRWHPRRPETVEEVERLREAERRIAATTGWNSSTMVIGRLLQRLRSETR
jgi:hypothetical protein